MLPSLLVLSVIVAVIALPVARAQYRRYGHLTVPGLALLCLMLFVPNYLVELATRYEMPETFLDYAGVAIALFGLVVLVLGMSAFRSAPKVFCLDTGQLSVSGVYRWSRNPQYVGWLLFLTGFILTDWSLWCLAALLIEAVSLHFLVLIEEEHLRRAFGRAYANFCRRVPRYFPLTPAFLAKN